MTSDRWHQVTELFHKALARDPVNRNAFVREACDADSWLRNEVEKLVAAHDSVAGQMFAPLAAALDSPRFPPGTLLGTYRLDAFIGAGGMGEVYRATDTTLGRSIALKILPAAFAHDPERTARFRREAQLLASLNHPHIAQLYGLEQLNGMMTLVMEFVDGVTLADRITQGPISCREAIGIARQITHALDAAHQRGIIHRDLKPANIKVTVDGTVKLLDFGLAKQVSARPTRDSADVLAFEPPLTRPDVICGTPGYMAPEQIRGTLVDKRADIWAFGCVLYEMLTRRSPFSGSSMSDTIAAVLVREPSWDELPATLSPNVRRWLIRCLEKDPQRRARDIADVSLELDPLTLPDVTSGGDVGISRNRMRVTLGVGMLAAGLFALTAVGAVAYAVYRESAARPSAPQRIAFTIGPTPAAGFTPTESSVQSPQFAVSPDGRYIAFVATGVDGVSQIWLRSIDAMSAWPLAGTINAEYPFWSASGRSIGFFNHGQLLSVDINGGVPRQRAQARAGKGGAWNAADTIIFSPDSSGGLYSIGPDGSVRAQTAVSAARRETSHRWPQFLPDGRHYIYFAKSVDDAQSGIRLARLDAPGEAVVVHSSFGALYSPPDYLLYISEDTLLASRFDLTRGRLLGEPTRVVEQIATSSNFYGAFSTSTNGVLVYATRVPPAELVWVDRNGRRLGVAAGPAHYVDFKLSPDGRYVAVAEMERQSNRSDVRLLDLERGTNLRLTTSPATDASPIWSPDGSRIVFRSNRDLLHDLYVRQTAGGGTDEPLMRSSASKYPTDWTLDGRSIVYHAFNERTLYDVWAASVDHPDQPRPLVQTDFVDVQGRVSPSGRWVAYTSNLSSRFEVYVQALHADGRKWQVSTSGGSDPRWRADERELYYVSGDGQMMSVAVSRSTSFDPSAPRPLFRLNDVAIKRRSELPAPPLGPYLSAYDVQRDGQRFLLRAATQELQTHPINVLVNWSVPEHSAR